MKRRSNNIIRYTVFVCVLSASLVCGTGCHDDPEADKPVVENISFIDSKISMKPGERQAVKVEVTPAEAPLFTMLNSEMAYQTQAMKNSQLRQLMDINQGVVNQFGNKIMDRALNIQPSVRVPNGKAVSVSVNAPLSLRPFKAFKAEQKWIRS